MSDVLILVTHLSGSGHLARALAIARAVAEAGGAATVLSGGRPLPHLDPGPVRLLQLPPLHASGFDYATLRAQDGAPAGDAVMAARAAAIAAEIAARPPATFVTELYPFGRRALRAEYARAVALARAAGARVVASVRDIPEPPRKPGRAAAAHAALRADYAMALVHGDPALLPFEAGWPEAAAIADLLRFTGYVAPPPAAPLGDPAEVQATEGGGALGRRLLAVAVEAARLGDRPWRLRVGGADAEAAAAALAARAAAVGAPVAVAPVGPDHRGRLATAAAAVCLCGYNTAVDVMQTGVPTVFVPMTEGGEREQSIRAAALARAGAAELLDPAELAPETLAAAVARAVARGRRAAPPAALDGARAAARLLLER